MTLTAYIRYTHSLLSATKMSVDLNIGPKPCQKFLLHIIVKCKYFVEASSLPQF